MYKTTYFVAACIGIFVAATLGSLTGYEHGWKAGLLAGNVEGYYKGFTDRLKTYVP